MFEAKEPADDPAQSAKRFATLWMAMAEQAADIAASKRKIYLAYVAEGFTELQALELVKSI